jgi:hypothetical protein
LNSSQQLAFVRDLTVVDSTRQLQTIKDVDETADVLDAPDLSAIPSNVCFELQAKLTEAGRGVPVTSKEPRDPLETRRDEHVVVR